MKPFLWIALLLCAFSAAAQEPAADGAFDRLSALLEAIPARWKSLSVPRVRPSGRPIEDVLGTASRKQGEEALQRIARLRSMAPAERPALIEAEIRQRSPTEVDPWLPIRLAQSQQLESLDEAAVTLEACLQWAEALGRKDALLLAASLSIDTLRLRQGAPAVLSVTRAWAALPPDPRTERGQAALRNSVATVHFRIGETQEALDAYQDARRLAVGDPIGQGEAWKGEADVLFRLGKNRQALGAYQNARKLFRDAGSKLSQGGAWRGEADVLFRLGRNQEALDAYRSARALFQDAGSKRGQGNTWRGEADVRFRLGENEAALSAYRNARELFLSVEDQLGQGESWCGEANVLVLLGENQKALDAYQSARAIFQDVGSKLGQGSTWRGEADILFRFGENEKALAAYGNARELFVAAGDQREQGNTWKGEADVFAHLGENQKALDAYRSARELFLAAGDQLGQGNTWRGEADILLRLGEDQKSLDASRNARRDFLAVGDRIGQGNSWLGEARALRQSLDWQGAGKASAAAIQNFRSAGNIPNQIPAFLLKAEAEERSGDVAAAARSAREAIGLHSRWRKTWITDRHRTDQEETISRAYDLLVPLRARQAGQAAEALRLAEESRSRVLLDLLASGPGMAREGSFAEAPPLDTFAIQALARDTGPLLIYYAAEREVWGFLVLPGEAEIVLRPIALSWRELGREVRHLIHDLANPLYETRADSQARKLWDLLIAPFGDRIPAGGPLVLVPHGPLHELPFDALLDPEGKRLFERWQTSVTPSTSALDFARRGHAAPSSDDFFLAISAGEGLSLPVEEIAEVSSFFGANQATLRPAEAIYQSYEKLVSQARHLLIATRGVHIERSRTETYLEIEPTPEVHDSRLTAAEIATIPLKAELVTLAACDTSYGQALLSDERLDLTRSFLIARAAAVLATRWKVPEDTATSRFLADFYRSYRQGRLRKDEALTEARRRSRERGDPAQVWAAWVLVGDPR